MAFVPQVSAFTHSSVESQQVVLRTLQLGMEWFPETEGTAGGLNRVFFDCMNHLPKVGVHVQGLVVGGPTVARSSSGLVSSFAPMDAPLLKRWQTARQQVHHQLLTTDYDLVVSHFAPYAFPVLSLLGDRPLVTHFHGPWALESNVEGDAKGWRFQVCKWIEQTSYNKAQKLIVLSEAFQEVLHREFGIPLDRIHIVPSGVEVERFDSPLSQAEACIQLGWPQDRPILLVVRRLAKRMGLENLIAAMEQVRAQQPDVLLMIAGKGPQAEALKQRIEERNLSDNVRLLGFVSDEELTLAYRAAIFSVVPTIAFEGFGLIVVESLAAGTPVLGTPIGGIPEILRPFSKDLLFDDASAEAIARGLREVFTGQRNLPDADACKTYVNEHYAWPVIANRIKGVYQSALRC